MKTLQNLAQFFRSVDFNILSVLQQKILSLFENYTVAEFLFVNVPVLPLTSFHTFSNTYEKLSKQLRV